MHNYAVVWQCDCDSPKFCGVQTCDCGCATDFYRPQHAIHIHIRIRLILQSYIRILSVSVKFCGYPQISIRGADTYPRTSG